MIKSTALLIASALFFSTADACTAFQLKAEDGSFVTCRSMEFGFRLNSDLLIVPQGMEYTGTAPQAKPGLKWKTKYGFVGLNQSIAKTVISDGMNEKGLTASILYLPGFAEYEKPNPKRNDKTLGAWELPAFLLGTCATIEEVKAALPTVLVAQEPVPALGEFVMPLHFYLTDRSGAVLVVEYIKGKRYLYDNPLGVLTNSPPFDWHLNNLANFINLSPVNISSLKLPDWTVSNKGQGSGLLGLPGDYTSSSRFVRAAFFSQWATPAKSGPEAVNLGFHILNTFDIFDGIIRTQPVEKDNKSLPAAQTGNALLGKNPSDITEWVIVHDRTHLKTYFRTYASLCIQMVDLTKIDFTQEGFRLISLAGDFAVQEVTANAQPYPMK